MLFENSFEFSGYICEEHNNPADFFMDVIFEHEAAQRLRLGDSSGNAVLQSPSPFCFKLF